MSDSDTNFTENTTISFLKKEFTGFKSLAINRSNLERKHLIFHAQTIIRRKRNKIHKITLPNGTWTSKNTLIQQEAKKFFKDLFCISHTHKIAFPTTHRI